MSHAGAGSRTRTRLAPRDTVSPARLCADADGIVVSDQPIHK